jgi:hypothetical protein
LRKVRATKKAERNKAVDEDNQDLADKVNPDLHPKVQ